MPLNCNQVIALLDCHRGYRSENHTNGQHQEDLKLLNKAGLIELDKRPDSFEWTLTLNGRRLTDYLLQETVWRMEFTPGRVK